MHGPVGFDIMHYSKRLKAWACNSEIQAGLGGRKSSVAVTRFWGPSLCQRCVPVHWELVHKNWFEPRIQNFEHKQAEIYPFRQPLRSFQGNEPDASFSIAPAKILPYYSVHSRIAGARFPIFAAIDLLGNLFQSEEGPTMFVE